VKQEKKGAQRRQKGPVASAGENSPGGFGRFRGETWGGSDRKTPGWPAGGMGAVGGKGGHPYGE